MTLKLKGDDTSLCSLPL